MKHIEITLCYENGEISKDGGMKCIINPDYYDFFEPIGLQPIGQQRIGCSFRPSGTLGRCMYSINTYEQIKQMIKDLK